MKAKEHADDKLDEDWEHQVDAETDARLNKIQKLRIAESGSGEYDDERKPHRILHFFGWMLLIVVLTAGGGFAGWYFWLRKEVPAKATTKSATPALASAPTEQATENYNSPAFLLQFDYPASWKVAETTSNKLTVTSTAMQLKAVSSNDVNKTLSGQVIMTIQHKQTSLPEFATDNALAARESERIEYAKPSQSQRAATYISFLSYASSAAKGQKGVDGIYVTGDSGYTKDQIIPQADIVKGDPVITITFRSCVDTKCSDGGQPLTLASSYWDDANFAKPIKAMLQSVVVQ